MHGMVNKLKFVRLGLTALEAATLAYAIERSIGEKLAQEEAWTCLGLNGDEMTKQAIAPKLQHPYGCGTEGLIGCDGGLKHVTKSNGTKCQPRADFCVSDGRAHVWVCGKLEGRQNICDAEFMAKTVATMICAQTKRRRRLYTTATQAGCDTTVPNRWQKREKT